MDIAVNGFSGGRFKRTYYDMGFLIQMQPLATGTKLHLVTDIVNKGKYGNTRNGF